MAGAYKQVESTRRIKSIFINLLEGTRPFIVFIETDKYIIWLGTLGVRSATNIIKVHILLTLLENTGPFLSTSLLMILIRGIPRSRWSGCVPEGFKKVWNRKLGTDVAG